jgi:hypothetical protein
MQTIYDPDKKTLTVILDVLDPLRPSKSGKTLIVASSNGNQRTTAEYNGRPITVGANAYIKPA